MRDLPLDKEYQPLLEDNYREESYAESIKSIFALLEVLKRFRNIRTLN